MFHLMHSKNLMLEQNYLRSSYNPSAPFYAHTELIGNDGVDF
jgi:hypothetical protein